MKWCTNAKNQNHSSSSSSRCSSRFGICDGSNSRCLDTACFTCLPFHCWVYRVCSGVRRTTSGRSSGRGDNGVCSAGLSRPFRLRKQIIPNRITARTQKNSTARSEIAQFFYILNSTTSPSFTIYSLPSVLTNPPSRAEANDPASNKSFQKITSARMNLSLKSV